jgi:hypothetical protein
MAATYTPIASVTLGASSSSVIFNNIPQTYTDLILVCTYSFSGTTNILGQWNGDTGNNYSYTYLEGYTTVATSGRGSNTNIANLGYSNANQLSNAIIHFMNYSNATTHKTVLNRQNQTGTNTYLSMTTNLWRSTNPITLINIFCNTGTMAAGSTFNLYGILGANA